MCSDLWSCARHTLRGIDLGTKKKNYKISVANAHGRCPNYYIYFLFIIIIFIITIELQRRLCPRGFYPATVTDDAVAVPAGGRDVVSAGQWASNVPPTNRTRCVATTTAKRVELKATTVGIAESAPVIPWRGTSIIPLIVYIRKTRVLIEPVCAVLLLIIYYLVITLFY